MMRFFVAFIVLTALLTGALVYMYYIRGKAQYEGFSEDDIHTAESTVSDALSGIDQPTIAHLLGTIKRMSSIILSPSFFTNAVRQSGMSSVDLAREYIQSQKAKSE